ncbi:SDR family oxidoreductase [Dyella sp. LX-66]|uniref:SDR family oxidoreductase n=1 Tax=unclassified Dyella TaxID=2634549 RepID=UPI001BDF9102|nr:MULTISPECIES: SDR family oxidoreductase [unclassified Dyella]MBT2116298.1 SDR family oxidoreductase [Dyella sp. LX-1]MBT2140759.1 SDR family oxidoreductase [Dyella sp. LX-66]
MSQQQKTALVTGASGGIGRAIALRLAADGFAVAVHFAGNPATADKVVKEIEQAGGRAAAMQGDVAEPEDMRRVFDAAAQLTGAVDVVVHSAGIMSNLPIAGGDLAQFDRLIRTNLRGAFVVLGEAAQRVPSGGRIIALSTSVIGKAFPTYGPYIATKAGVEGLVHVLANELRGRNVAVNAIAPGPVGTELFYQGKSEQQITQIANLAPMERLGTPDDIARAVAFLAGPDGAWVNAQVLRVNGGMV